MGKVERVKEPLEREFMYNLCVSYEDRDRTVVLVLWIEPSLFCSSTAEEQHKDGGKKKSIFHNKILAAYSDPNPLRISSIGNISHLNWRMNRLNKRLINS